MGKVVTVLLLLLLGGCEFKKNIKIGEAAPRIEALDLRGATYDFSSLGDKIKVVRFWELNCPSCLIEMPQIEAFYKEHSDKVEIVAINLADYTEPIEAFIKKNDITYTILRDKEKTSGRNFGVLATPTSFILDGNNIVRDVIIGELEYGAFKKRVMALF